MTEYRTAQRRVGVTSPPVPRMILTIGVALACAGAFAQGQSPDPSAALFEKTCYSCHNIGSGDKKGPDLKDVHLRRQRPWLHRFIASAKGEKDKGDPTAVSLFKKYAPEEMPDQLLTPDQIDQILDLIERVSKSGKAFVPQSGRLARPVRPGDAAAGYRLYVGSKPLAKGGPACISCHSVQNVGPLGGGTLGPDLTQANVRYTDVELASILKAPAFPTMSRLFDASGLTDEEVVQLFAYLQSARLRTPDTGRYGFGFVLLGMCGTALTLGLVSHVWRRRLRGGVRRDFVARAAQARRARLQAKRPSEPKGTGA